MACRQMVERQHLGSTHNSRQCSLIQLQQVEWQTPSYKWPAGVMQQLYRFEAGSVVNHRGTEYSSSRLSLRSPSLASISISSSTDLPSSDSLPCVRWTRTQMGEVAMPLATGGCSDARLQLH